MKTTWQHTCFYWKGDCGQKAVAETRYVTRNGWSAWKPICGQHLAALKRRKGGVQWEQRSIENQPSSNREG